jgi:hypothetical protein
VGMGREDYFYVNGKRVPLPDSSTDPYRMIWNVEYFGKAGVGPEHEKQRDRVRFFVGTKSEYDATRSRE